MSKATILIVEDEAIVAADLAGKLGRLGYGISATTGVGEDAVDHARKRHPDLVLMDIRLAGAMDGIEAAEIIRRDLDLPVIFLTAHSDSATLERAKLTGPFGYILKPFEERELATHIEMALFKHQAERKLRQANDELERRVEERTRELKEAHRALKEANETLEQRVAERTADLEAANASLRDARRASLNMMEDAIAARRNAETAEAELKKTSERLDVLAETASRLLASDAPQQVVDVLCQKVMAFLDCHAFFNFLVDEEAGRLHLNACAGIPEEEAKRIEWLDYGVAVCGCAARDACRIVAEDIPNTPDPRTELVKSYGIEAYACHPLMSQGKVIGTLSFGTRARTGFSDDDLSLMKAVADQVAIAMERKHAAEVLQKAHDELEARVRKRTDELAGTVETLLGEIAERERAETLLRESEKKFRTLFEESKDMIYLVDADGRLVDVNPAGTELCGYTREEFFTLGVADLYCDQLERECFLQTLHEDGFVRNQETQMLRKDGEILHVLATASVTRDDRGEITGYRGIVHDISERKSLEQQLNQAQKMESIGLLAGGVAHDFNNLMTAVTGYGQLIRENIDPGNELLTMCSEQLLGAAERAAELTRNLLAFGRKQIINPKPVPVNEIIINVTKLLTRIVGEDIEFRTNLTSIPLMVLADRGQIDQVLVNLVANARDAMPDGGKLCIGTLHRQLDQRAARHCGLENPGEYALITVTDTGTGMDERTRERIFEPFFTTKELGKGTGLGLSIIYGIVKQHNGAITAESEPGKGTIFTIYLPVVQSAVAEARKAAVLPAYGTETILLAEDDAIVRHFMEEMLKLAGFTVVAATNGEEAISLFRQHRDKIALVVSDVVMPRKNGKEVFDDITRLAPGMKFIFTSGYTDDIIHKKGLLDESLDFLMKPVGKNDLLQKVREVLDR